MRDSLMDGLLSSWMDQEELVVEWVGKQKESRGRPRTMMDD